MNLHLRSTRPNSGARRLRTVGITAIAGVALAASLVTVGATAASASTLNGTATIANPSTQAPLSSGGSATPFTVTLPSGAACTGDTATHGYHVYSYLEKKGVALSSVTFVNFPSTGLGLVDNSGTYYGAANTAIGTGQIVSIPNDLQFAPLVTTDGTPLATLLYTGGTSGVWEAGIACANSSGTLTDNWNTEVTFAKSTSDAHGFTWTAVPGVVNSNLHFTTTSLPALTRGTPYSFQIQVAGGTAPYKFKKVGKLPKGLKLGKTGILSGTVSTKVAAGSATVAVTVSDSGAKTAKQTANDSWTLTIN